MSRSTRVLLPTLVIGAAIAAFAATRAPAPAPEPARIATCDVYGLMDIMMQGEPYKPAQDAEQARLQSDLMPLKLELERLQKELQAARPDDLVAQDKYRTYQTKGADYESRAKDAQDKYGLFVVGQYSEAYDKILVEARKAAAAGGYTHVVAVKRGEIKARNPQQLVEEFLSRPLPVSPSEADLTETVRVAMKLPEKAATPAGDKPSAPAPAGEKPPAAPEKPAAPTPAKP